MMNDADVGKFMQRNPKVIQQTQPISQALWLFEQEREEILPVVDSTHCLLGELKRLSVLQALLEFKRRRTRSEISLYLNECPARMIMEPCQVVVYSDTGLQQALDLMSAYQLNRLFVVKGCVLIGSINRADVDSPWPLSA